MSRERSLEIVGSSEYNQGYLSAWNRYHALIDKSLDRRYAPVGVNGYTTGQEEMLSLALAMVVDPELEAVSQCTHRAVSACIVLQFETGIGGQKEDVVGFLKNRRTLARVVTVEESDYVIINGVNNWVEVTELPEEQLLDCKFTPGIPMKVPRDHLVHLPIDLPMAEWAHVDNACPKRLHGASCNIMHAERSVILFAAEVCGQLNLPPSKKTMLTSTWVPCPHCLGLITSNRRTFGGEIDVVSVFSAQGDEDDINMARQIRDDLQRETLGHMSGPFIAVPKVPGYGWYPARRELMINTRDQISSVRGAPEALLIGRAMDLVMI